jgi:hypothetical protein
MNVPMKGSSFFLIVVILSMLMSSCGNERQYIDVEATVNARVQAAEANEPSAGLPVEIPTDIVTNCASSPGRYSAGTPVCVDELVLTVDPDAIHLFDNRIEINLVIKNIAAQSKIFRYAPSSINIYDDVGNNYVPIDECTSVDFNTTEQVQIKEDQSQKFSSGGIGSPYCAGFVGGWVLPTYSAEIPTNANEIIISFDGFGPFSGMEIVIDL